MAYTDYIRQTPEGYIRVVSSSDYDSIVSYTPLPDITVFVDAVVNLPNTVEATFKSGKTETMVIKWERVNVDTSNAGTQKIYGDIGNGAAAVLQNVIVNELSDLDILRQIRDANPTSQLPLLWLDSEDPYTQWDGASWQGNRVTSLSLFSKGVTSLNNVNKLKQLYFLDIQNNNISTLDVTGTNLASLYAYNANLNHINIVGLNILQQLDLNNNNLTSIDISGCPSLRTFAISNNQLISIPTLTSKWLITSYNFRYNNMPTTETDRIIALGFDSAFVLPQNP